MTYIGRPGPSPVLAGLLAAGFFARGDRVLDAGCGNGVDAIEMGLHGLRVTGVDLDRRALAAARRRARRAKVSVGFVEGDVTRLPDLFERASFDAAVDTLLSNNLRGREVDDYAKGLAHCVRKGGLAVFQERVSASMWRDVTPPPEVLGRWFTLGPSAPTHLPESPERERAPEYARIVVTVGVRNARAA